MIKNIRTVLCFFSFFSFTAQASFSEAYSKAFSENLSRFLEVTKRLESSLATTAVKGLEMVNEMRLAEMAQGADRSLQEYNKGQDFVDASRKLLKKVEAVAVEECGLTKDNDELLAQGFAPVQQKYDELSIEECLHYYQRTYALPADFFSSPSARASLLHELRSLKSDRYKEAILLTVSDIKADDVADGDAFIQEIKRSVGNKRILVAFDGTISSSIYKIFSVVAHTIFMHKDAKVTVFQDDSKESVIKFEEAMRKNTKRYYRTEYAKYMLKHGMTKLTALQALQGGLVEELHDNQEELRQDLYALFRRNFQNAPVLKVEDVKPDTISF